MTRRKLSFYTGTALTADSFATLASFDGRGHPGEPSGDFSFDLFDCRTGIWRHVTHGKDVAESATAWRPHGLPQAVAITRFGNVVFDDLPLRQEQPYKDRVHALDGSGDTITAINNRLYAIGGGGHFFWRDADSDWAVLDPDFFKPDAFALSISKLTKKLGGLPPDASLIGIPFEEDLRLHNLYGEYTATFYTLTGTGHDNLVLAGPEGRVLHFDGQRIHKIASGVTVPLTGSCTAPDGTTYLCGTRKQTVVLKGTAAGGFAPILQTSEAQLHAYKMACLGAEIYICDVSDTNGGLYRLEGDRLQKITIPGAPDPAPIWKVDVADGVLWALEAKALNRFDGATWARFESPFV